MTGKGGQTNKRGLTREGEFAIREMMRHGMLIDIDHMSDNSKNMALDIAEQVCRQNPAPRGCQTSTGGPLPMMKGYPLNSGHAGLRGFFTDPKGNPIEAGDINERSMSAEQYKRLAALHGMAGIGSDNLNSYQWAAMYEQVLAAMGSGNLGNNGVIAGFGTDTDGGARNMPPRPGSNVLYAPKDPSFPISALGNGQWNYNAQGVAHYGMLPDFLRDVKTYPSGGEKIFNFDSTSRRMDGNVMYGADYFLQTWKICEVLKGGIK